ncbi:FMN-binding glutamate synthase family protein [Corynebacterium sp. CCUG 59401]|nr:FMN-binding glutamate synthase family protein [Corynebacterium pseudogenitalium]
MGKRFSSISKLVGSNPGKTVAGAVAAAAAGLAANDLIQPKNNILRNYPVLGHARYLAKEIRPEIHQYFIEGEADGKPFDAQTREVINQRADGTDGERSFGTEREVSQAGYEYLVHSVVPAEVPEDPPRVNIGGAECSQPYDMALMNISGMSFGALSANAIRALNKGAELGGFAHNTGEGGLSEYHLENNGDIVWQLGTGYFGCRTEDGGFDEAKFKDIAQIDQVKMIELKLSQGAKPGLGGMLPGPKVTEEIARVRDIPVGEDCLSPSRHRVFSTPVELIEFIAHIREVSGGKPIGFKMCVGSMIDVLSICKAIEQVGTAPDFITIDGAEGGTAAAPLEFEDHMGLPLTEGLQMMHNALVGTNLRDKVKLGASGKVAASNDIVKRLIQGADYTNSARAMMMAVGCIQAQKCQTGKCPSGVATQSNWRQRAIDVDLKAQRVQRFQQATVRQATTMMAACGASHPDDLTPAMLRKVIEPGVTLSYEALFDWLEPGQLLDDAPDQWAEAWRHASPDEFRLPVRTQHR